MPDPMPDPIPDPPTPDPQNSGTVQEVKPDVILSEAGHAEEGTFTQKAGMKLAKWVGALGALVTIVIVGRWIWMSWCVTCPTISATTTPDQATVIINNYKALQTAALESAKEMFDTVVVKALLPVFTSILGYIFGARAASEGQGQTDEKAG